MSDPVLVENNPATPIKRKAGRPPKKRHDPPPAPVDGDYSLDEIVNKAAGFDYGLISKRQRGKYQARGWIPERYSADCARSKWDYGEHVNGDEVTVNSELTLMKIPSARRSAMVTAERRWHSSAKEQLRKSAEESGGRFRAFQGIHF